MIQKFRVFFALNKGRRRTGKYDDVSISNLGNSSFGSGLALCALVHCLKPSLFEFAHLQPGAVSFFEKYVLLLLLIVIFSKLFLDSNKFEICFESNEKRI